MKYGIITHYDVHNHGAILQLNALIKVLESQFGIESQALQFEKNYDFIDRKIKAKYVLSLGSCGIYLQYLIKNGIGCFIYNYLKRRKLNSFKSRNHLIGPYYTEIDRLNGVIVGSDEVFALHTGPTPVFFGYALPSDKVFSYAGSFGPTTIQDIKNLHCIDFVSGGLKSMMGLGVRDKNSYMIVKALTKIEPIQVCDPVILYGYKNELEEVITVMKKPYMVVYSYDHRLDNDAENILSFAHKKGWKVVSPGFYQKWADKNVNVDPVELLHWIKGAEAVVTNTFHGCVMSIITGRDMAVRFNGNSNKLYNLLQEYGLDDRIYASQSQLERVFDKQVNWDFVSQQVMSRRAQSMDYLKRMINEY